jgi:predicted  nucleic acid-binding Zn-ribbon protein
MRRILFVLLQSVIVLPGYSQHEIRTSGLAEVEKMSKLLNKEHAAIRQYMDSTISAYNKAVETVDSKRSMAQNRAYTDAERSERGQEIISEIKALRVKRDSIFNSSSDRIENGKARQEEIDNELNQRKERCESLQKQVNIAAVALKLSKASAELAETTYKNFGGTDNYENYRKAAESYNSQSNDYNSLFYTLEDEVNEYNSMARDLDREYNAINSDLNNYTDEINASLNEMDSEIAGWQSELDNLKASYFDEVTVRDKYYGATKEAQQIREFEESGYYDLISAWYGIDFYLGKDEAYRNVAPDAMTKEGMAICSHTGPLFDTLCAMVSRFEHNYFKTLSRAAGITVKIDGKAYPDIQFFSTCLSEEPSHSKELESFRKLFNIPDYKNCEDFFNQILNLDNLYVDSEEYPLEDLSFLTYLPSLKYLNIENSNFKSFQPLFDIGYSGKVSIAGAKNFTTSELKDICKKLHSEFGAECIYKK